MICGLLGEKLGHSYSPQIHAMLADYSYTLFEKNTDELESFLRSGSFHGINVTIPYKKSVIPFLDALSPEAERLGAVNTIVRRADGSLIGHNTDYFGFQSLLNRSGLAIQGKKALVLGSGGASNTACAVLREHGARVVVISRNGENNYTNLQLHADAALIVNATPVGMYPKNGESPLSLDLFPHLEGVIDVVYNPARTQILLDAEARGLVAMNGLWMLVAQAKESAEWFSGKQIDDAEIMRIYQALKDQMENVILIGMPGCGKSVIGRSLSEKLGRELVDADAELEKHLGVPIAEFIPREGEAAFRNAETAVLSTLGKRSGLIIATGGGCITRPENYPLLHQNGTIVWIQRQLASLPTDGRPLSKPGKLAEMYAVREPLYQAFADFSVSNTGTVDACADKIIKNRSLT